MKNIDLNGLWDLIEMPLDAGVEAYEDAARATALCKANVPGDVSDALFRAGLIPDYKVGLNFKIAAERANNSSWWLRREFENVNFEKTDKNVCSTLDPRARAVLSLGGLDVRADIWLNGTHIGHHPSAFYPFEKDVLPLLKKAGNNTIIVRLTTGADRNDYPDYPLLNTVGDESARDYEERGKLPHRIFLRKPAYSFGWDWSPNMPTCGIAGDCEMRVENETEIESVKYFTRLEKVGRLANGVAVVRCVAEIRRNTLLDSASGTIVFKIGKNKSKPVEFLVRSGITVVEAEVRVKKPLLWWPNNSGAQCMHAATATLTLANGETLAHEAEVALRTVAIDD
ncbi:MAG: hypothetical protein FWG05_03210, partial [Kiritimatiellaeota bacterium]|nr:hypothetical protein [Kiritimatiellota bacterium]